jgi:hypothetical protein
LPALEDGRELAGVVEAVGNGQMERLVQRSVLDHSVPVAVKDRGGEAARILVFAHVVAETKNPSRRKQDGFRVPRPESPG